jgi:microsomal epoxide hydrolase
MKKFLIMLMILYFIKNQNIEEFKIDIKENILMDLKNRLNNTIFPETIIKGVKWEQGTNIKYLKEFVHYWKNDYDWKKMERLLNEFQHFKVNITNFNIHFIHMKSEIPTENVVLLLHGWPGSFFEFYKISKLLLTSKDTPFNIVIPSLPGYGFSEIPHEKNLNIEDTAVLFINLMKILKYDKYYVQGGDWGSIITTKIAELDEEHCLGIHLNMAVSSPFNFGIYQSIKCVFQLIFKSLFFSERDLFKLKKLFEYGTSFSAYMIMQVLTPDTIGSALSDSPSGLASYIIEKFYFWSDINGDLESKFTKDELITNLMIYWVTNTITSSQRYYYSSFRYLASKRSEKFINVPTGIACFKEDFGVPKSWTDLKYNTVQYNNYDFGGHFAALEIPQTLYDDFISFIKSQKNISNKREF